MFPGLETFSLVGPNGPQLKGDPTLACLSNLANELAVLMTTDVVAAKLLYNSVLPDLVKKRIGVTIDM